MLSIDKRVKVRQGSRVRDTRGSEERGRYSRMETMVQKKWRDACGRVDRIVVWEMSWVEIGKYVMEYQWKLQEFVQTIMEGVFKKTTDISIKNTYTKAKESKWT